MDVSNVKDGHCEVGERTYLALPHASNGWCRKRVICGVVRALGGSACTTAV